MNKLSESWPWNREFLRLFLYLPGSIGVIATVACFPIAGAKALWFLTAIPTGLLLRLAYGIAGQRVSELKAKYQGNSGEVVESLMVIGKIQSPGVVILRSTGLELIPIAGDSCSVRFFDIERIQEGRWLPGKYVMGKRAFILHTLLNKRIAFAVAESIGQRWHNHFNAIRDSV